MADSKNLQSLDNKRSRKTSSNETRSRQPSRGKSSTRQPRAHIVAEPLTGNLCAEGSLAYLLIRAAEHEGRGIVFVQENGSEIFLSYRDILERAKVRLMGLQRMGLKAGALAILTFQESAEFVLTFWACMLGGIIAVPLAYPTSFSARNKAFNKLLKVWESLEKPIIIVDKALLEHHDEIFQTPGLEGIRLAAGTDLDHGAPATNIPYGREADLAFIQYSSGSTGNPKGVMLTHGNLLANIESITTRLDIQPEDSYLSWMPYSHDMGLIGFHLTPIATATNQINLTPAMFLRKPTLWLKKIHEHRATLTGSPNFGYRHVLEHITQDQLTCWDLSSLRLIFNGAEPISAKVMRRFMETLAPTGLRTTAMYPVYGMAEASLAVSFPPPHTEPLVHSCKRSRLVTEGKVALTSEDDNDAILIADEGIPVPGMEIRIVSDSGRVVSQGKVGHVQIWGPNVTQGYYKDPAATKASKQGKWLKTGDLGLILDNRLCITGRAKEIIFVHGQNFFAHDVETCAEQVPGVLAGRVVACGWHDAALGREQTVLFVNARPAKGSASDQRAICTQVLKHVNESLGLLLDYLVFGITIPRTTSGKPQRHRLLQDFLGGQYQKSTLTQPELLQSHQSDPAEPIALSTTERRIRRIWAEILGSTAQSIDVGQPFLSLGGTSVKAVQVLGCAEKEFAISLPYELLLKCQTVREMACYVDEYLQLGEEAEREERQVSLSRTRPAPAVLEAGDIAIISMACRFPDAATPMAFWNNLVNGADSVREIPPDRWDIIRYYQEGSASAGRSNSRWGGFIDGAYDFDAEFFNVADSEATVMDPQQRLSQEVAWEVLERAGYAGERSDAQAVGLFIGVSHNSYLEHHRHTLDMLELQQFQSFATLTEDQREALIEEWKQRYGLTELHPNTAVDNLLNMIAARTSHTLNLKGPSLAIDTACSSSLVAVHMAAASLRRGECSMAIVGGINLLLTPTLYLLFAQSGALSPTGRCRVFDAKADGFVPGEGVGMVLLKPLDQALADGDRVLAVIKGSAMNNDGRSLGVMAPNPDGQREVIEAVYRDYGLDPADVQYVEAHGTGTPIGDPSEVRALSQAFTTCSEQSPRCVIGSVKANIGHLLSAAGIASLIKVVLALQHQTMPPSVHLEQPNPQINFPHTPFNLIQMMQDWEAPQGKARRAAINSFGFGGTNCHMVVEEAPVPTVRTQRDGLERPLHLLCLSAHNQAALQQRVTEYAAYVRSAASTPLADVCASAHRGRGQFRHRASFVADSTESLLTQLESYAEEAEQALEAPAKMALMFTGQGSQYPHMAAELYQHALTFRRFLDECCEAFAPHLEVPLLDYIYGEQADVDRLAQTNLTQPATFALDYAVGRLLMAWGVQPDYMLGHSVGEYAAACLAGVFDLSDAAQLVAARGRLMHELPVSGGMAAVLMSESALQPFLEPYQDQLWIAGHNGSHQVVAGHVAALERLLEQLRASGKTVKRLRVSHAFHTPLMTPMLDAFGRVLENVQFRSPERPIISNVTGELANQENLGPDYWKHHILAPVRFEQSIRWAQQAGAQVFIEAGPDKTLASLTRGILAGQDVAVFAALDQRKGDWASLLETLGGLYGRGLKLDWEAYDADYPRHQVDLPTYPFQRQRFRPLQTVSKTDLPAPQLSGKMASESQPQESQPRDWFHTWQWSEVIQNPADRLEPGAIVVLGHDTALATAVAGLYDTSQYPVYRVSSGKGFQRNAPYCFEINPGELADYHCLLDAIRNDGHRLTAILHLWNCRDWSEVAPLGVEENATWHEAVTSVLLLGQVLQQSQWQGPLRFLVVTQDGYLAKPRDVLRGPHQVMAGTLTHALAQECPEVESSVLDLESKAALETSAHMIMQELQIQGGASLAAYREQRRLVRHLEAFQGDVLKQIQSPLFNQNETCLITGGASGIGAEIARALARQGPLNLVLSGRRPLPPRDVWDTAVIETEIQERVDCIRELEALGAKVLYQSVDVSDPQGMTQLLQTVHDYFGPLHGVVHAAGVVDRTNLHMAQKRPSSVAQVFAPKVEGTRLLDQITQDEPLKYFVLCSSIAASETQWSGSLGDYASANAFLDSYSEYRTQRGGNGRTIALNWSLWDACGMGKEPGLVALVQAKGLRPLSVQGAIRAFESILATPTPPVVHIIDRVRSALEPADSPAHPAEATNRPAPPRASHDKNYQALVRQVVGDYLDKPAEQVDGLCNFRDQGLDSKGAMEVLERLSAIIGQALYPTLLFEYQTPDALAAYLEEHYAQSQPADTRIEPVAASPEPEPELDALRAQDIAIVGMACKIPGANSVEEFRELLFEGRSAIGEVPEDRWRLEDYFDSSGKGHKSYSRWGAFVDRPYDFDPLFFGISPREATAMDPQQRLFLEVAWQALQQSGYGGEHRTREIGVFVGCEQNGYVEHFTNYQRYALLRQRMMDTPWFASLPEENQLQGLQVLEEVLLPGEVSPDVVAGNGLNEIPARLSHWLDLKGPSLTVNTACSSALVALHLACNSLRSGECRMAVVGGVNLNFGSTPYVFLSQVQALSHDGSCRPFDKQANGMVLGEGGGALVLKPLRQAIQDRDYVHAVIKGSAINNDGHSQGLTAPNPSGQADAIRKAYQNAEVHPETISYIETHGTGTTLGDPIEVEGMTQAFRSFTERTQFCAIGSVKSSIGHMLSAASIPSVIKVILAMQEGAIPHTVGFNEPNPYIDFDKSPFYVAAAFPQPWRRENGPRRAGVNAFGFGGTNCHVILEESPPTADEASAVATSGPHLLCLTGRTPQVISQAAGQLHDYVQRHDHLQPDAVCLSMNRGQRELAVKVATIVDHREDLLNTLKAFEAGRFEAAVAQGRSNPRGNTPLALVLDGQTVLTENDISSLCTRFHPFSEAYEAARQYGWQAAGGEAFVTQYALGSLLQHMGIRPTAIVATGSGLLAAACLIGAMSLEQAAAVLRNEQPAPSNLNSPPSGWTCPIITAQGVLQDAREVARHCHSGDWQAQLRDGSLPELTDASTVFLHLGGDAHTREQCLREIGAEQWVMATTVGNAVRQLLTSFARLYAAGIKFDTEWLASHKVRRIPLPTYPFERKTYLYAQPQMSEGPTPSEVAVPPAVASQPERQGPEQNGTNKPWTPIVQTEPSPSFALTTLPEVTGVCPEPERCKLVALSTLPTLSECERANVRSVLMQEWIFN
jgi:acyl transferase domain-containing protein/acyl-CoA synthetase (AMP-forming)/AMP-acid ligase II/acyl carrier protein